MASLEERREVRKEVARRWLLNHPEDVPTRGKVAQWVDGKAALKPWQESMIHEGRLVAPREMTREVQFQTPRPVKRTPTQRVEAMINRLKDTPPGVREVLLDQIKAEYWKLGSPVDGETLKALAAHFLNKEDNKLIYRR